MSDARWLRIAGPTAVGRDRVTSRSVVWVRVGRNLVPADAALILVGRSTVRRDPPGGNGGPQVSLGAAAEHVRRAVTGADIELGPGYTQLDRQGEWDTSLAARELGYTPAIPLAEGIASYAGWLREHPY